MTELYTEYNDVMSRTERRLYQLRMLYASKGYMPYKMSKFEEYDLYGKNRDFLVSDRVITFTDTDGKLMALKPDVTLSVIKNNINSDRSGHSDNAGTEKLYYNESVYRVARSTGAFKEIMQMGIECIGGVTNADIAEVITLAVQSLERCGDNSILSISDLDILTAAISNISESKEFRADIIKCIEEKNLHGIAELCAEEGVSEAEVEPLSELAGMYGNIETVLPKLKYVAQELGIEDNAENFANIITSMDEDVRNRIVIDFSVVGDINYYNGLIFKGFVQGIPTDILSGGQYDGLLRRMKYGAKGIGFAINMDALELPEDNAKASAADGDDGSKFINIALPKGRLGEKVYDMFERAGYDCPSIKEDNRKLIFENADKGIRFMWVKPSDVAIYVERGATDIGVCGKDILMEYEPDVYELADLNVGKCKMTVSGPRDFKDDKDRTLRVATKFVRTARNYYASLGRDIDIIQLNGSIEIAPIIGLSDVIVDIVETGTTLKENNLEVKEEIYPISARLISNKSSFKFKNEQIERIKSAIESIMAK